MGKDSAVYTLEARLSELDANLELSYKEIFDIVCQEFKLDANSLEKELNCKCPFALVGYLEVDNGSKQ
nr:hypothetical protein [Nostoc sp. SerVER01]